MITTAIPTPVVAVPVAEPSATAVAVDVFAEVTLNSPPAVIVRPEATLAVAVFDARFTATPPARLIVEPELSDADGVCFSWVDEPPLLPEFAACVSP